VAIATSSTSGRSSLIEITSTAEQLLPPGSRQFVEDYVVKRGPQAWKVALLGWMGTLLAGSQVMKLIIEGVHTIYGDADRMGFLQRHFRGLLLLLVTLAPMLAASILGILGRPMRHWLAHALGHQAFLRTTWTILFSVATVVLGMIALAIIYRVARPAGGNLRAVLPGAVIATLLWWAVDVLFGAYVHRMRYGVVYGGLAAVIGLMVWMQFSAVIVFLGAAWNAEASARRNPAEAA
jgi:membrane protein